MLGGSCKNSIAILVASQTCNSAVGSFTSPLVAFIPLYLASCTNICIQATTIIFFADLSLIANQESRGGVSYNKPRESRKQWLPICQSHRHSISGVIPQLEFLVTLVFSIVCTYVGKLQAKNEKIMESSWKTHEFPRTSFFRLDIIFLRHQCAWPRWHPFYSSGATEPAKFLHQDRVRGGTYNCITDLKNKSREELVSRFVQLHMPTPAKKSHHDEMKTKKEFARAETNKRVGKSVV